MMIGVVIKIQTKWQCQGTFIEEIYSPKYKFVTKKEADDNFDKEKIKLFIVLFQRKGQKRITKKNVNGITKYIYFKPSLRKILDLNNFKKQKNKIKEKDIKPIILVSIDRAEDIEKRIVFFKFGFLRKLIPVYILIIVKAKKKISWGL